jgi:hypothetical protein
LYFRSVCDWSYGAERSDLSQFYNSTTNSLVMPPNSAWSTVGMVSQHSSFQVGSGVVMLGGNGMMPSSTQPQPVPTAVNMRSWFAKLSPVCPFTTPVNLPALFASNLRQVCLLL